MFYNPGRGTIMRRRFTSATLLLALFVAACSALPLPADLDLKARLGSEAEGSFEQEITAGETGGVDLRHPSDTGECINFSDVEYPVTVEHAQLHYNVDVTYAGPELSGKLQAQLYAAPIRNKLWLESNKVGPTITLNLNKTATRLAGTAVLNPEQLQAINNREICWGLHVTGKEARAEESGTATFTYTVNQLRLNVGFSVLEARE